MLEIFAKTKEITPVLNRADFSAIFGGEDGASLPLDNQGLLRAVETLLFENSKVCILERYANHICRITTNEYPTPHALYVDSRFLEISSDTPAEREKILPSKELILHRLQQLVGASYVWGGNWSAGVSQMQKLYPPTQELSAAYETVWSFKGVDCSGLLYEATRGALPRNSSDLLHYGNEINAEHLQALDLIVWKGHVIIVLDTQRCIESRAGRGVFISSLQERLQEVKQEEPQFSCRRWC